jgi:cystathionine gamma-synthase
LVREKIDTVTPSEHLDGALTVSNTGRVVVVPGRCDETMTASVEPVETTPRPHHYRDPVTQEHRQKSGFDTRAIHAGYEPDPTTGAVIPPIYATSTYKQDGVGGLRGGYEYSRSANPTRTALEGALAALEEGERGFAFASGLAAEDTILRALTGPGDHVVVPDDAYGGTFRLFEKVEKPWGLDNTPVAISDLDAVRAAIRPGATRMVWVETPTNPLLNIADIQALASLAHQAGALLVVDNTFASPYLQQPLSLGADIVVHSTTKYVGGHSDVVGGAVVVRDLDLAEAITFHQNAMGAVPGPFDCFLTHRGIKTLGVRMDRHCDNAERVVEFLTAHPKVAHVYYPGLPEHPGHDVAARQMKRFGGMVAFRHADGEQAAVAVCARAEVFILGESLGGVESLIEHPGRMTHMSVVGTELEVPGDLIRLSVGIETADDLVADLDRALG